ncbi:facilitated trehalose transporter Tret1-like [Schistocerca serialis cubense]|uniref:facilitated trehalose transporter Tret1-like n=1 Tax=Schistocerca serialis cubense TaxID=2023355 RepID=UPI00214E8CD5|nr:facilitated trehalose transporter Tret1-like [Schistocerca serialis cubense]
MHLNYTTDKDEADCEAPPATPPPSSQHCGGRRVSWANTAAVATLSPPPPEPARHISVFRTALPQVGDKYSACTEEELTKMFVEEIDENGSGSDSGSSKEIDNVEIDEIVMTDLDREDIPGSNTDMNRSSSRDNLVLGQSGRKQKQLESENSNGSTSILASSVKNLLLLDLGMVVAYPTIMIPALQNEPSAGELCLNDEQTSWIGSIAYICQPVGAVVAGALLETLGRKRSMLLVNAPLLAGWLVFYWAARPEALYAACAVLGLSVGFMESSVVTYVGEISQPELRGMLTSYAELCVSVGFFVEYLLGTVTDWRNAALISALLPIISVILITQVPETPIWLVSRGRTKDAENALRWLRGWVQPADVQAELNELCAYYKQTDADEASPAPPQPPPLRRAPDVIPARALSLRRMSAEMMTPDEEAAAALAALHERHRGSQNFPVGLPAFAAPRKEVEDFPEDDDDEIAAWCESAACRKVVALLGRGTLKPLLVVSVLFFFQNWAAATAVRPYAVEVCDKFGMPIDSHWATVATGATGIVGNVLCMVAVHWTGKRPLTLASLALGTACCLLLAVYAQAHTALPPGETLPVGSWAPLLLFVLLYLTWSLGIVPIPWMLLSEIFPYRTRGLAAGVAAALSYVWAFTSTKTYLDMEEQLTLYGAFYLYAAISAVGFVFVYFLMAETEGRSLQDIERHYAGPAEDACGGSSQPPPALKKPRTSATSETGSTGGDGCGSRPTRCEDTPQDGSHASDAPNSQSDVAIGKSTISDDDEKTAAKKRDSCQPAAPIRAELVSGNPEGECRPKPNVEGDTIYAPNSGDEPNGVVGLPVDQTSSNESSHSLNDSSPSLNDSTSEKLQCSPTDESASSDRNDHKEDDASKNSKGVLCDRDIQASNQCNGHHKPATVSETDAENVVSSAKM